jgi:metal-responsive CopG/Arc/MetJ family transcriptional regulator
MLLEPREVQELDEYRYSSHIPSRAEAIRTLVQIGLKTVREKKEESPK